MFERWLKRTSGPEPLDLTRHRPTEFVGKTVTVDGRDYLIGHRVRQNNQGFLHRLVNQLSGLCQHAIQIRVEYMQAPDAARAASLAKAKLTADMRATLMSTGNIGQVPFITVTQAHGGSFELHETGWGTLGHESEPPGVEGIREAEALFKQANYGAATARLERVLADHPYHTVALKDLASCHMALGNPVKALAGYTRAVEIEPNIVLYRGSQLWAANNCPRRYQARILFDDLQTRHPHLRDFDYQGIRAYLGAGESTKARDLLGRASLRQHEAEQLRAVVDAAVQAHELFASLENRMMQPSLGIPKSEEILRLLEEMSASYPLDPFIQANLGCALGKVGEHQRAAKLLMSAAGGIADRFVTVCWTNAAYCLIALSQWKPAMALLKMTMDTLKKTSNGRVEPRDVPGIAVWIGRAGAVQESMDPSAAELLDRAIIDCPDPSLIGSEIREMAALLHKFKTEVARAPTWTGPSSSTPTLN